MGVLISVEFALSIVKALWQAMASNILIFLDKVISLCGRFFCYLNI